MDLALNSQQRLIDHKTKPNQTKPNEILQNVGLVQVLFFINS